MRTTTRASQPELARLQSLARHYGVELEYDNAIGVRCEAPSQSLLRALQLLGAPINQPTDADGAILDWRIRHWQSVLEPVSVVWSDKPASVLLRSPGSQSGRHLNATLLLESGEKKNWQCLLDDLPIVGERCVDGTVYQAKVLAVKGDLPIGYHQLEIEIGGKSQQCMLISAPRRAYDPDNGVRRKVWGAFIPLYALRSSRNWGCGDLTDLASMAEWVGSQGGEVVGTLPLLAAFLDIAFEPSPYSPASRLFWNELYLDVEAIPEFRTCQAAKNLFHSEDFANTLSRLRSAPLVDYRQQMRLKKQILTELATNFFKQTNSERQQRFELFLENRPDAADYARFRSVVDQLGAPWTKWSASQQNSSLDELPADEISRNYHLYVQWIAEEQMASLSERTRSAGTSLYLDLPLGVNRASYDVYRNRDAFVMGAAGGCPPDAIFRGGQNWAFPPMHPQGIRNQQYKYIIQYLRHQFRHAGIVRIDHMPMFHRLFWIPDGMEARDGVYVRYPADELYAVFSVESHRQQVMLVGEDLGTVPPEVSNSMDQHNVHRMFVVQYVTQPNCSEPIPQAPMNSVASLNTHDMPPFAAFVKGDDIRQRRALDLLGDLDPVKELELRSAVVEALAKYVQRDGELANVNGARELLLGCIEKLAHSSARTVLLNLEDLWGEEQSQNLPGTSHQFPNWQRKASRFLEELAKSPEVIGALAKVKRT